MSSSTIVLLRLILAVCHILMSTPSRFLDQSITKFYLRAGMNYEMSRLIPPQFDTYGVTFWIPSQVEPTVALIGASMPALRHAFTAAVPQLSRIWTSLRSGSTKNTEQYGSLKANTYHNVPAPHSNQSPYGTEDTTRILHPQQQPEHPPRPYIQLQEWRQ